MDIAHQGLLQVKGRDAAVNFQHVCDAAVERSASSPEAMPAGGGVRFGILRQVAGFTGSDRISLHISLVAFHVSDG